MKERPIIFNTEMVKAIKDGRKTQTRRLRGLKKINIRPDDWELIDTIGYLWKFHNKIDGYTIIIKCPYGQVGDKLYVRESWATDRGYNHLMPSELPHNPDLIFYLTDWPKVDKKRPSIHMPRWASRIELEITEIRAERLQEITPEDALNEGIPSYPEHDNHPLHPAERTINHFIALWNSINGKKYPWDSNPWVWRIEFRRIK